MIRLAEWIIIKLFGANIRWITVEKRRWPVIYLYQVVKALALNRHALEPLLYLCQVLDASA